MTPRKSRTYKNAGRPFPPLLSPKRGGRDARSKQELIATFEKNRKGFGFLVFADRRQEDVFVPPQKAAQLFHGDRVEVALSKKNEIVRLEVLSHRFEELVGRLSGLKRVIYERKRGYEEVYLSTPAVGAQDGDWVRVKLSFKPTGACTGEVVEVYGPDLPSQADIPMVASEYGLKEEHSADAEEEARLLGEEVPLKDREDFRHIPFITIDGPTARDFDDAVFVEREKSGYCLWVGIADVSLYVREGSAIDEDAKARGTSVYFPERAFHMLPRALSENLCSLRPGIPRLVMVARMHFDYSGQRTQTDLFEAVIQSRRRATYEEIQAEWDAHRKDRAWEYRAHFELFKLLKNRRADRGSIDFDLPEAEVLVDPVGEPISITQRPRLDAHRLIEEFMIAANEAVTDWMMQRAWPFVYRIHEEPAQQALFDFQKLAASFGVIVEIAAGDVQQSLSELAERLRGHPAESLLNMMLLRSMKQAVYSAAHGIHFGLASPGYTHFTSPIRRYPDLVVHRLLRRALHTEQKREGALGKAAKAKLEKSLEEIAAHCSVRERLAADAERESNRIKQVRLMRKHLGDEYPAKVIGMIDNGLFLQVEEPFVEGFIPREALTDDIYEFREARMIYLGARKKQAIRIGDAMRIKVVRADVEMRQIDFAPVDEVAIIDDDGMDTDGNSDR